MHEVNTILSKNYSTSFNNLTLENIAVVNISVPVFLSGGTEEHFTVKNGQKI